MGRLARTGTRPTLTLDTSRPTLSKRQLEINLSKLITTRASPKLSLEQYPVSAEVAAELLYMAGFEHDDIYDRKVLDLGTGTGRLAIGAALLGAKEVEGIDLDEESIRLARQNTGQLRVKVGWRVADVEEMSEVCDTVLMNPPYGTRVEHADTHFLDKAFQLGNVVYTIHKASTRSFIRRYVVKHDRIVDTIREVDMQIPHLYDFHKKRYGTVRVDLYRIVR